MAGETLDFHSVIKPDALGERIALTWQDWENRKVKKKQDWKEVREYVYQTDTTQTTNSKLPWKNTTTTPKLCQIRDNLIANYEAALFPRRKWLLWEGDDEDSTKKQKKEAIQTYMNYVTNRAEFKKEVRKALSDYIDYGNAFLTPEWRDGQVEIPGDKVQKGFVGPELKRISPLDINFNPVAKDFIKAPKIVRTFTTLGELKKQVESLSNNDDKRHAQEIFDYVIKTRSTIRNHMGDVQFQNEYFQMDGFTNFTEYLQSDSIELLTFYGDLYDVDDDIFWENRIITVVDRHKILINEPHPSFFGHAPIYHAGWRVRQDNLWAMGPLDNLVGLQYRLDHLENMKSDVLDFNLFPVLVVMGYVDDFEWAPGERIMAGEEGKVDVIGPDVSVLQSNIELDRIIAMMEEMAGAPKEAMGFRTPGEKTKFEVQRLENAASRIFQHKIKQFEEVILEPALNAMLEMARRFVSSQQVKQFDEDFKFTTFTTLTANDITGEGRIKPIAARHFAEQSQILQDLNGFFTSPLGQDQEVMSHFSSLKLAQMIEKLIDIEEHGVVKPFVRLSERTDGQRMAASLEEQLAVETTTSAGVTEDDFDESPV